MRREEKGGNGVVKQKKQKVKKKAKKQKVKICKNVRTVAEEENTNDLHLYLSIIFKRLVVDPILF